MRTATRVTPAAALARDLVAFGDQRLAFRSLAEEDDRRLRGDARVVRAVADIGEGGVGEREDHPAVRDAWPLSMSARTFIDSRA